MKKYNTIYSNSFKRDLKKIIKQGKDLNKLNIVIEKLSNNEILEPKYKDHKLINDKYYKDCRELHIEPDWLIVYQYLNNELVLLLVRTGSHNEILNK